MYAKMGYIVSLCVRKRRNRIIDICMKILMLKFASGVFGAITARRKFNFPIDIFPSCRLTLFG